MAVGYNSAYSIGTMPVHDYPDKTEREPSIQDRLQSIIEQMTMAHGALDSLESIPDKPHQPPAAEGLVQGTAYAHELAVALRDRIQQVHARIGRL